MRTCLTSAAIAALVLLGLESVGLGQQSQSRSSTSSRGSSASSTGVTLGTGGGQSTIPASEMGQMERLPDVGAGEFVGISAEDVRDAMTATGGMREGTTVGRDQTGRSLFGSSRRGFQPGSSFRFGGSRFGSGRTTDEIRTKVRLGFTVPKPARAQLARLGSKLATRMETSSWLETRSPMEVAIEGNTAILRGVVASEHDRSLAERLAKLEPGIRRVENRLTLAPASESPSTQ
jgi:hypothetical protein